MHEDSTAVDVGELLLNVAQSWKGRGPELYLRESFLGLGEHAVGGIHTFARVAVLAQPVCVAAHTAAEVESRCTLGEEVHDKGVEIFWGLGLVASGDGGGVLVVVVDGFFIHGLFWGEMGEGTILKGFQK